MKKTMVSLTAAAVLATTAFSANPTIATDGTGDMLIAPAFFASGSFETKVKVVNTNTSDSVILRVVVRDAVCSREVDFPILLSPGDAWEATLTPTGANGASVLTSTDDSSYPGIDSQLETGITLSQVNTNAEGKFSSGYIEFLPVAQYSDGGSKVDKPTTLATRFDTLATAAAVPAGANVVDNNSVTGTVTVTNTANNSVMSIPMTALEDVNDRVVFGNAIALGQDTNMDLYLIDSSGANTNHAPTMNLLKKQSISVPYSNGGADSMVLFTHWNDQTCSTEQIRYFKPLAYDMEENKPTVSADFSGSQVDPTDVFVYNELGYATVTDVLSKAGASYSDGWFKIQNYNNGFTSANSNNVLNAAATVIPTYMRAVPVSNGYALNWTYLPFEYSDSDPYTGTALPLGR